MSFRASVLTLYPEMFPGPLGLSLAGRALERGDWRIETTAIRQFGEGRHRLVDDTPAGGSPGMVLRADVLARAIDQASPEGDARPRLLMSPRGRPLTQRFVRDLAAGEGVVLVCGRFEGVDERVIEGRGLTEVSIGDYILSGGEMAALILLDAGGPPAAGRHGQCAVGRDGELRGWAPGTSALHPSALWEGRAIPAVLTSGDHGAVERWRRAEAERITTERRPDLLSR